MKINQCGFTLLVILLIGGNCFGSQGVIIRRAETDAFSGAYLPKDPLMIIGAAADDKTRDSFRTTSKFFHQELSIKSFKKLIELPLLNTLKLGYFACHAAWERDTDLLKKIMPHMKNIYQHYQLCYTFAQKYRCIFDLPGIIKIRMPQDYEAIAQLAQEYSNYSYFCSSVTLYDKVKYACYEAVCTGKGLQELQCHLDQFYSQKYYEEDSHLESLFNFLCMAIEKDSAICAHAIWPHMENILADKTASENYCMYKKILILTISQQKDKTFKFFATKGLLSFVNKSRLYQLDECGNRIKFTMLDYLDKYIKKNSIPHGKIYIHICRNYGWKTHQEMQAEKETCIIL